MSQTPDVLAAHLCFLGKLTNCLNHPYLVNQPSDNQQAATNPATVTAAASVVTAAPKTNGGSSSTSSSGSSSTSSGSSSGSSSSGSSSFVRGHHREHGQCSMEEIHRLDPKLALQVKEEW
jgi:hypothetical protein